MESIETRFFIRKALRFLSYAIDLLNEAERKTYAISLEAMRKRLYDPEFRLAIVGDFSCGKSTFLNALIGEELLTTDTLPTTAIPTYIRWNKEELLKQTGHDERRYYNPIVTLTTNDGKTYTLTKSVKKIFEQETNITLPEKIGAAIDTLTTTNSLIGKINRVELTFREKKIFAHFCLIDTPGINPGAEESKEHILQTQKVLREEADAFVVLYSFKDAMNRGTEEFMKDNAGHLMAGAIILLTKMDLVPPRQIEKIFRNTEQLVKERYGQKNPKVYGIAALSALEYRLGISNAEEDSKWADDFDKTITEIITQLSDRRTEIISRRILELMNELIESLTASISEQLMKLEKERETLERASIKNLMHEFQETADRYIMPVVFNISRCRGEELQPHIHTQLENIRKEIFSRIEDADSIREINRILQQIYPAIMDDLSRRIYGELTKFIIEPLNQSAKEFTRQAEEILKRYNRYLGAITPQVTDIISDNVFNQNMPPMVVEDYFSTDFYVGIIGIVFPVLAEIIDFFRMSAKRREAKEMVQESLYNYEARLLWNCTKITEQVKERSTIWIQNFFEEYRASYSMAFETAEKAHRERVHEVERKIAQNKDAIERLEELRKESTARAEVKDDTKA